MMRASYDVEQDEGRWPRPLLLVADQEKSEARSRNVLLVENWPGRELRPGHLSFQIGKAEEEIMSLICIEGVLGVGKTALLDRLKDKFPCIPFYEEVEANPFLSDFYQNQKQYAMHVQYTFLFLQERRFRAALEHAGKKPKSARGRSAAQLETPHTAGKLAICDFHPFKSLIFSSVVLTPERITPLRQLYRLLTIPEPDLVVYLKADVHTILARLRKRNDICESAVDLSYLMQVCQAYDDFFRSYKGDLVTIDTTCIDYVSDPQVLSALFQEVPLLYTSSKGT